MCCSTHQSGAWSLDTRPGGCAEHDRTNNLLLAHVIDSLPRREASGCEHRHCYGTKPARRDRFLVQCPATSHAKSNAIYVGTYDRVNYAHVAEDIEQARQIHVIKPGATLYCRTTWSARNRNTLVAPMPSRRSGYDILEKYCGSASASVTAARAGRSDYLTGPGIRCVEPAPGQRS
jgi:hypothetical protein